MQVLFIGCLYSANQKKLFYKNSKRGYQYAAQNFQEALIEGFLKNKKVSLNVLSIPSLSTYPKGCNLIRVPDTPFCFSNKIIGKSFGYLNLPFLNKRYQCKVDNYIDEWYLSCTGEKTIIVYAMLREQMQYAVSAKERHPDIQLCIVIPDLPLYMNCNKYYKLLGLQKRDMDAINSMVYKFDSYVVLAKSIIDYLGIINKPYIVVEGIYKPIGKSLNEEKDTPLTIMYAGGIQTRYGVFDLIEAFHRIERMDIRLLLCGGCLEMDKLNEYLIKDKRIHYLGMISTSEVRILQKRATLLVNPRHSTEEFTKYSFPSKTLEYMASGTPVLMSKLPSMPLDYEEHLFLFEDESIDGICNKINEIIGLDSTILNEKGMKAKRFIMDNKVSLIQVSRIMEMLKISGISNYTKFP